MEKKFWENVTYRQKTPECDLYVPSCLNQLYIKIEAFRWRLLQCEYEEENSRCLDRVPSWDCLNFFHAAGLHTGYFFIKPKKISKFPVVNLVELHCIFHYCNKIWKYFPLLLRTRSRCIHALIFQILIWFNHHFSNRTLKMTLVCCLHCEWS